MASEKSINPPPAFNSSHFIPLSHLGWILIFASFHRWHLNLPARSSDQGFTWNRWTCFLLHRPQQTCLFATKQGLFIDYSLKNDFLGCNYQSSDVRIRKEERCSPVSADKATFAAYKWFYFSLLLQIDFELKPSSIEMSLSFLHFSSPLPGMFSFLGGGQRFILLFFTAVVFFFLARLFLKIPFAFTSVLWTGTGTHFCGPAVTAYSAAAFLKHCLDFFFNKTGAPSPSASSERLFQI